MQRSIAVAAAAAAKAETLPLVRMQVFSGLYCMAPAVSLSLQGLQASCKVSICFRTFLRLLVHLFYCGWRVNVQLREFIHEALYQPAHGYFSANQSPVGLVDAPIDFRNLWGKKAYDQATTDLRNRLQVTAFAH